MQLRFVPINPSRAFVLLVVSLYSALVCWAQSPGSPPQTRRFPRQKLRVAVHDEYARVPVQKWDQNGTPYGFSIELLRALTVPMGYQLEFVRTTDEGRWLDLRDGRADILPFVAIPEARQPEVAFTQPILRTEGIILSRFETPVIDTAIGLRGMRIGNTRSGVSATWMDSLGLKATHVRENIEELLPMLRDGVFDYLPVTRFSGNIAMEEAGIRNFRQTLIRESGYWRSFAIATRVTDTGLLADLNDGIDALQHDGHFDRIHQKWLQNYEPLENPRSVPIGIAAWIGGGLLLIAALALAWQFTLRRELNRRTRRLTASEEKYARLFESCQEAAMVYLVQSGEIVEVNQSACELYGFDRADMLGRSIASLQSTDAGDTALRVVRAGRINWHRSRHQRKNGGPIEVEVNATRIIYQDQPAILTFNRDLTHRIREEEERHRLEEAVHHAQRVESLGLLAGGVAHDFNNLLLAILGHTELAALRADDPVRVRKKLSEIELAATRAAELTKQLLAYAGKTGFQEENILLTPLVREIVQLVGNRLNPNARIVFELPERLPPIRGDATMLRQTVMNLLINASDALGELGGTVRLRGGVADFDRPTLSGTFVAADIPPGSYAFVEIADTGKGMSEDVLKRIFEPFFSTKFTGRGLGLAVALRTVQRHNGALKVRSKPGMGTVFQLLLPPAPGLSVADPAEETAAMDAAAQMHEGGWVLVVDDAPDIRDVLRTMLESRNWTVTTASDGAAALEILQGAPGIQVIVLDLTMPGICGRPLVDAMRAIRPGIPILLVSGYHEAAGSDRPESFEDEEFLAKPFTLKDLMCGLSNAAARASKSYI